MADPGNTGTTDDKDNKGNVTINNYFPDATIGNFANQAKDSASQNQNTEKPCSSSSELSSLLSVESNQNIKPCKSATFIIEGSIKELTPKELARLKAFVESLKKRTGDASLTVTEFSEGSIRLTIEGSEDSMAKLQELVNTGELSEVVDRPVSEVCFNEVGVSESTNFANDPLQSLLVEAIQIGVVKPDDVSTHKAVIKHRRMSAIQIAEMSLRRGQQHKVGLVGPDLSEVDLSGVELIRANLLGIILTRANLSQANLNSAILALADLRDINFSQANLNRANLVLADLRGANFYRANLNGANLACADLSGVSLSSASVERTILIEAQGLANFERSDLIARGAILEDSSGDRSFVRSLVPR